VLWSGARRAPLAVAHSNRDPTAGRVATCKSPVVRQQSDASPSSGGRAMMCSGARRSSAAVRIAAVPSSPRQGMPQSGTPRLGQGAQRVPLFDGRVSSPGRALAERPPASPFASLPAAQPGDPLAFGTPNSAFRRPPLRLPVPADDDAAGRRSSSPAASPPRSLSAFADASCDRDFEEYSPEASPPLAAAAPPFAFPAASPVATPVASPIASPVATSPLSVDGLYSGARHIATTSRFAASPLPPKSSGLALRGLATPTSGTAVRLVQARASASQHAETGSSRVVTPARRSMRVGNSGPASAAELLEATNYAYAPNIALVPKRKEEPMAGDGLEQHGWAEDASTELLTEPKQLGQEVRRGAETLESARSATTARAAARRVAS
jgi:hypothetical protein